jgi:hypothetical protein
MSDRVTEYSNYANMFDFPELVEPARTFLQDCSEDAAAARETWVMVKGMLDQNDTWCNTAWSQVWKAKQNRANG